MTQHCSVSSALSHCRVGSAQRKPTKPDTPCWAQRRSSHRRSSHRRSDRVSALELPRSGSVLLESSRCLDVANGVVGLRSLKLHISEFPSSDVRNAREILTRSVSEGDTSQRFQSVPSLTLRVEKDRNVQLQNLRSRYELSPPYGVLSYCRVGSAHASPPSLILHAGRSDAPSTTPGSGFRVGADSCETLPPFAPCSISAVQRRARTVPRFV